MSQEAIKLSVLSLGEWGTNCHVLISGGQSVIIDPAAEAGRILAAVKGTEVQSILLTHAHGDHIQALEEMRQATGAPVGEAELTVVHTPGHTPGSVCFRFDRRAVVGDTLFPGGPGHSRTPQALTQILANLQERVFTWPDETAFYPGHGEGSTIGSVRPAFEAFMARPRPDDLCGDVEWV
jgi:hydroxyacylglutathione hydrolase